MWFQSSSLYCSWSELFGQSKRQLYHLQDQQILLENYMQWQLESFVELVHHKQVYD